MNGERGGIQRIEERAVYANEYLTLYDDRVAFPSGAVGTYVRGVWHAPHSVAIVAVTHRQEYVLIRSFSYAVGRWLLQTPKGFGRPGIPAHAQAEAELSEETGFEAERWHLLTEVYTDPGFFPNPTYVFCAEGASAVTSPRREPSEAIAEVVLVPCDEAVRPAWLEQIPDAVSRLALLTHGCQRAR